MWTTRSGKTISTATSVLMGNPRITKSHRGSSSKSTPTPNPDADGDGDVGADDPIYFWRESDPEYGWLSQWYPCAFEDDEGRIYATAEHYMMYQKAQLFSSPLASTILSPAGMSMHPRAIRKLGRQVENFSPRIWEQHRSSIVANANYFKFARPLAQAEADAWLGGGDDAKVGKGKGGKGKEKGKGRRVRLSEKGGLKKLLLDTDERLLVEASPFDAIWGIGMHAKKAREMGVEGRESWGLNLLGLALGEARGRLRREDEEREMKGGKGKKVGDDGDDGGEGKGKDITEDWVEVDDVEIKI